MYWLLEVEIDGRVYSWSLVEVEIEDRLWRAGLLDPGVVADGSATLRVGVLDPRIDWPDVAPGMQGCTATLRRWFEGDAYAAAVVVVAGIVEQPEWDTRDAPVRFVITTTSELGRGEPVPPPLATSGSRTWPQVGQTLGDEGVAYPVIFGYPGYEGTEPAYPVVPLALAQWSATRGLTYAVCCEDPDAAITALNLRNEGVLAEATQDVGRVVDLLGRAALAADFGLSATGYPPTAADSWSLYAGYSPAGGGGPARSAYEVIVYLLRRWAPETIVWDRLAELRGLLDGYLVDTWIDQTVPDPWSWLERTILPDLPVQVRIGAGGRRYLVPRVWRPLDRLVVAELTQGKGIERASTLTLERAGPMNEFTAEYRQDRSGVYRSRVVFTGDRGAVSSLLATSTAAQSSIVVLSGRCQHSRARFGRRPAPVQAIDWTWDEGTVWRVIEDRIERDSIPALVARYTLSGRLRLALREGDVVRLTDDERGLDARLATVAAPVAVGVESSTITLRIPQ